MNRIDLRHSGLLVLLAALSLVAGLVDQPVLADGLVSKYEPGERAFKEYESGALVVYYHQRMVDDAIVEKDYVLYQFDKATEELVAVKSHWREDLPEHLPAGLLTPGEAEALVDGEVLRSTLYLISPESDVFPLDPVPQNPCWVVRHVIDGNLVVTVVDAAEGRIVGNGVPPPNTGFALSGPWTFGPCEGTWTDWRENARSWFETMGYPTESVQWPDEDKIRSHVQSGQTAVFYELAHGNHYMFEGGCINGQSGEITYASEIETWIADYAKMPFAFIGSCGGLCWKFDDTFSYEFRKGSTDSTTALGYCGMADPECDICWSQSISWQTALFSYMNQGWTVKAAFDQANADHPQCGDNRCMRFSGDQDFALVPVVRRDPWPPQVTVQQPNGGEVLEYGTLYEIRWVAEDNALIDSIAILLSTDGGVSFADTIAQGEADDSSFVWTVPDVDSKTARIRVVAVDGGMNEGMDSSDNDFTLWGSTSGVAELGIAGVPGEPVLGIAGGNPLGNASRIVFGLPASAHISLDLYDITGRHIASLLRGHVSQGYHSVRWGGESLVGMRLSAGIYFLRLNSDLGNRTAKLAIVRN